MPNRMHEVASKIVGGVKNAKATLEGLTGVFKQLTQEHGEVTALLVRVKMTSDPAVRRDLFPTIRRELLAHEQGELEEVYPVFARYPELEAMARDHQAEASQLQRLLGELTAIDAADPTWAPQFARMVTLIEKHATEEENDYFPAAQKILGKDETERMKTLYLDAKARAATRSLS